MVRNNKESKIITDIELEDYNKKAGEYGVMSDFQLVIIVGNDFRQQLDYYHYRTITKKNREFVPVCNSSVTDDFSYNRYVLGYTKINGQWGYWKNKDALFLSTRYGPSLFVSKDKHKLYQTYRININFESTNRRLKKYRLLELHNFILTEKTFEQIYNDHKTLMFVMATVEFL